MLPGPLKLECSEFGRETIDDHLHHPWSVLGRLPRALRDLPIVLTCTMLRSNEGSCVEEMNTPYSPWWIWGAPDVRPER